jgi:mRNA-degrading endonuclease RelE of RelBE toxin-antitoxin system
MNVRYSERFIASFEVAPPSVQKAFHKQVSFLLENLRHPSLQAKKYDQANDIWQARVNRAWRFYFSIRGETYVLHDIIPHPK